MVTTTINLGGAPGGTVIIHSAAVIGLGPNYEGELTGCVILCSAVDTGYWLCMGATVTVVGAPVTVVGAAE